MPAGIDDVAWDELTHAYGPAGDVPGLIRATASADQDTVDAAVYELFGSVVHQGTVYSATPRALPFLVDIAARPETRSRELLLTLVGTAAASDDLHGVSRQDMHAALAGRAETLLDLLADRDPGVREMAAYILGHVPGVPLDRLRWQTEPVARVRASILMAAHLLDHDRARTWLPAALAETGPVAAAAAALTAVCGLPWSAGATAAVIDGFVGEDPLADWVWSTDWLSDLLSAVDPAVAVEIVTALAESPAEAVRLTAVRAAADAVLVRRWLPQPLVPVLAPLLLDRAPAVRRAAVRAVAVSGAPGPARPQLVALAAEAGPPAGGRGADPRNTALRVLIGLGDPRRRELLLAAWSAGRGTAELATALREAGVPADPELVGAARARLRGLDRDRPGDNERIALVQLLGSWGPAAASALPELRAALERAPLVTPDALAAVAPDAPETRTAIAAVAAQVPRAGLAWYRLTGEAGPLLRAVAADLGEARSIELLADLGEAARPLLLELTGLLTGVAAPARPGRSAQFAAARITWALTSDPGTVLPTVTALLRAGHWPAADLAVQLGDHAVLPLLRDLLPDQWATVTAARALWRLTRERYPKPLLAVLAAGFPDPVEAVALLVEMGARETAPRLRALAEQDARLIRAGHDLDIARRDDELRAHLRRAAATLG